MCVLAIFNNFRGSFCVSFNESIELMASIDKFEVLIKKKNLFCAQVSKRDQNKQQIYHFDAKWGEFIYDRLNWIIWKCHDDASNVEGNLCETFLVIYLEDKKSNINAKFVGMAYKLLEMIKRFF